MLKSSEPKRAKSTIPHGLVCAVAGLFLAGFTIHSPASETQPLSLEGQSNMSVAEIGSFTQIAQSYSPRCQTEVGLCFVPPQPVGTTCWCGNTAGSIIP